MGMGYKNMSAKTHFHFTKSAPKMFSNAKIRYKLFNYCQKMCARSQCCFTKKAPFSRKLLIEIKSSKKNLTKFSSCPRIFSRKSIFACELTDKPYATKEVAIHRKQFLFDKVSKLLFRKNRLCGQISECL
jgi:hypothetical protein